MKDMSARVLETGEGGAIDKRISVWLAVGKPSIDRSVDGSRACCKLAE